MSKATVAHLRAHNHLKSGFILSILASTMLGGVAVAQTPAPTSSIQSIEEIVVTVRRSAESLRDVPLVVSAFSSEALEKKKISSLDDVSNYTPGLRFSDFVTAFNGSVTIRGLQQASVQNAVGNVGVFIDNVYLQRSYMVNPGLGDWSRIEVVKGPQSALFGQNTFSGAINYVTNEPTEELKIKGSVTAGNGGLLEGQAGIGGAIVPGILQGRIYYGRADYNGVWNNNYPGVSGDFAKLGGYERESFSTALKFTPTDRLTIKGSYYEANRQEEIRPYYTIDGNSPQDLMNCGRIVPATGRGSLWCGVLPSNPEDARTGLPVDRPYGVAALPQPVGKSSTKVWRASAEYLVTDELTFAYQYGNVTGEAYEQMSFGSNPLNPATGRVSLQKEGGKLDFESHEARLIFKGDLPIDGEIGYYHSKATDRFVFGTGLVDAGVPIPLHTTDPLEIIGINMVRRFDTQYKDNAFFGRANYRFNDDRGTITGELRYTKTKLSMDDIFARRTNPTLENLHAKYSNWSPRVTAQYKVTPETMVYASVAKGEKAGGFNGYVTGAVVLLESERSYGPEKNWTYEVGAKGSYFGGLLQADLSLFYVDWAAKQIAVAPANYPLDTTAGVVPPRIQDVNGSAESYGIEVSGSVIPTDALRFDFSFSYQNPKYKTGTNALEYLRVCDGIACPITAELGGNVIEGVSKYQGTLSASYTQPINDNLNMFFTIDETYRGKQFVNPVNTTSIKSVWLTNVQMGLEIGENWRAMAWAKNVFNQKYVNSVLAVPTILQYNANMGELRTFGLTVSYNY